MSLKQGTLNNLGQTSGYDTVIKADTFELRPAKAAAGSGVKGRVLSAEFERSVDVDLGGALTSDPLALLPPVKPDKYDVQRNRGTVTGEAEYVLGPTRGSLTFSARTAYDTMPASPGLLADGRLITTHPRGGPRVDAEYQGGNLHATWDAGSTGHWAQPRLVEKTKISPFDRYDFSLLFPRPPGADDAGSFTLSLAGKDIATVKLGRKKQPGAPAPSPVKSARPGGPQAAAKTATGPLAYFDVIRDARSQAHGIVSASNLRQLGMGLQMYVNDHNAFPESLADLRPYLGDLEAIMVNPRTGANPGFIYQKPSPTADPASTPVIFESYQGQPDLNGAVLYGDGSIR